jgi:hypothetical protein
VRTHARKTHRFAVWKFVDEQQIGFQMAFAVAFSIAAQAVIAMLFRERLIFRKQTRDCRQQRLNILVPGCCQSQFIVALEG